MKGTGGKEKYIPPTSVNVRKTWPKNEQATIFAEIDSLAYLVVARDGHAHSSSSFYKFGSSLVYLNENIQS